MGCFRLFFKFACLSLFAFLACSGLADSRFFQFFPALAVFHAGININAVLLDGAALRIGGDFAAFIRLMP